MARSPGVAHFRTLLRALRTATRTGEPAETVLARWRAEAWSRRAFLGGLAATPFVGCGTTTAAEEKGGGQVVIVGAGLAGLNACHRLAEAGVRAEVVDARDRVGGRMWSTTGLFSGGADIVTELGGEWINSNDTELLDLVAALDLTLVDTWDDVSLRSVVWVDGARYTEAQVLARADGFVRAVDAALATIDGDTLSYADDGGAWDLDHQSAEAWLAANETDPVVIAWVTAYCTTEYGLDLSEQSALNLLYLFGSSGEGYDERYKIAGGNDQVTTRLAERYADRLHLSRALTALSETEAGTLRLGFADGTEMEAAHVILALPFTTLREVDLGLDLPEVKRRVIDELGYGTNAKVALPVRRAVWRDAGDSGFVVGDLAMQMGWDGSALQSGDIAVYANFVGGAHGVAVAGLDGATAGAALAADLAAVWPEVEATEDGVVVPWPEDAWVRGSYSCYRVGQWTELGGAEAEPVGNVFFAGEHTSTDFQGYLNGAAQSGRDAADAVIAARAGTARTRSAPRACRRFGRR